MLRKEQSTIRESVSQKASKETKKDYVVGIDTGGTYTDGVLLDYYSREVLASGKTLTTREDLTIGVVKILEELNIEDPSKVKLVGISSTLATNSIAEGKARKVGLLLIGYDKELISSYGLDKKFGTDCFAYFQGGHTSQGSEKASLDLEGIKAWVEEHKHEVDSLAVSSYFSPLNTDHEDKAIEAIHEICSLPVVLGNQLSTKLDSIKRATTACLNSSLVAIMQEFIEAVQGSLKKQGINAPLMIVRGDGSLMPYTEAALKPVETVMSGPAASSIGGRFLSREGNALVIDIGGTTTDMALIENFQMTITDEGARVGEIETAVKAAKIRTACVGCDSRIFFESNDKLHVGPDRVVPLSRLASKFEHVRKEILGLRNKKVLNWKPSDIEFWLLYKDLDPEKIAAGDKRKQKLLSLLRQGPMSLTSILEEMEVHHAVQLNAEHLIQQAYIEHATLTPTDLLHVNGQMDKWDRDVARQAVECLCKIHNQNRTTFVEDTLDHIVALMAEEAIIFLARQFKENSKLPEEFGDDWNWGRWFFNEMLTDKNKFLSVSIASRFPIIGIGAPAGIFIKKVAETLRAQFVLPPYPHVANAVGAVAGSVMVDKEAIIYIQETETTSSHVAQIEGKSTSFIEFEEACAYAEKAVSKMAKEVASDSGAVDPQVDIQHVTEGSLYRIRARAVGNPRLSEQWGHI